MSKKVLVISTSLRDKSNSNILADEFIRGAKSAGAETEKIFFAGKNLSFCKGCLACQKTGKCVIKDDAAEITEKIKAADVLVFATPIYFYEMSGQMKTLLDRCNPIYDSDYKFRDVFLLAACADESQSSVEKLEKGLSGFIECFPKCKFSGSVCAAGVNERGEAADKKDILSAAYHLGLSVK